MDTKFGTSVSKKMLLNAAKYQGCSFYCFGVIKGKLTDGKIRPPAQIKVKPALQLLVSLSLSSKCQDCVEILVLGHMKQLLVCNNP